MAEDRDSSVRIKVVDRRWFTEDGQLRPDRPRQEPAVETPEGPGTATATEEERAEATPRTASTAAAPGASDSGPSAVTSRTFVELVATLAQQAELLMTGGGGLPAQPEQAQRVIDYLGVLESKTRGNLSAEESQLLGNVLFELRTLFVQSRK